jgi:hypothetical protein
MRAAGRNDDGWPRSPSNAAKSCRELAVRETASKGVVALVTSVAMVTAGSRREENTMDVRETGMRLEDKGTRIGRSESRSAGL